MALESTDLLVVQKQSGAKEIRKASLQQLGDYLQTEPGVVYKGQANFTNSGDEPGLKNTGDLYINNGPNDGTWDWGTNTGGITLVQPGDRALWNGSAWDVIQSGAGDVGVTAITGSEPIIITGDADQPNVEVRQASESQSGAVSRLATDAEVAAGGSGGDSAVVTASQLRKTNNDLSGALAGGITSVQGVDPIETRTTGGGATVNSPEILIKDSAIGQKGAVALYDGDTAAGKPSDESDYATWVGTLDAEKAMSMAATAKNFAISDFSALADA